MKKHAKIRNLIIILTLAIVCVLCAFVFCSCNGNGREEIPDTTETEAPPKEESPEEESPEEESPEEEPKDDNPPEEPKDDDPPKEIIFYTLVYNAGEGGALEGEKTQTVEEGKSGNSIIAVPDEGYKFVKWSDGLNTPERRDTNVIADKTVTAEFGKIKLAVTYSAGEGGTIEGTAEQEVEYGNDAKFVEAVPNEGYRFVKWSDGNGSTIRRETNLTSGINVTAEFVFLYAGGNGSISNPFLIETYTQLIDIWYYPESNYKLINDLDLSGIRHEPIFDDNIFFKGRFFGNGYTVKNLTVETEINYPSLFGVIGGGSVSDLNISNAVIITTDYDTSDFQDRYYVGILAGMVKGFVHDINVSGEIRADGFDYAGVAIGGITGYVSGTVANCLCNVQINVKHVYNASINTPFVFGGLIGICDSAFIRDCNAEGLIDISECYWTESGNTGNSNKYSDILIGGLIGYYFTDRQVNANIRNCKTNIIISGDNHYNAGGFIGRLEVRQDTALQVIDCSVYGDITCGRVGGFVYNARTFVGGTILFEKCTVENDLTAFSYGVGFVYLAQSSSDGDFQIKNCYTIGNIKTCNVFDSKSIMGRAAGFGWQMSFVSIMNCYAQRDMNTNDGRGFSFMTSKSKVSSCFYEGIIDISNGAGILRGVGMFDNFVNSTLDNCYVNVNFVTGEKITSNLYAFIRIYGNSKLNNFYCYGNYCKILDTYASPNVVNGHVFRANIEESNLPHESDEADIKLYDIIDEMYCLADRLNVGQDEEVWIDIESGLPKLRFEIE